MVQVNNVTSEIDVLTTYFPIPGFGQLAVNAFVLKAREPVLVDTGAPLGGDGADATADFIAALGRAIDPADLKWIWLTHADMDHVACVHQILEQAPAAKVLTTFLTVGRMSVFHPLPMDWVYLLNPGQSVDLGDRTLTSVRPPSYDAADTAGCFDSKSRAFFSSDCFGGLLQEPAETAADVPVAARQQGQRLWATIDAPWLHSVDAAVFGASLDRVRDLEAEWVLSAHLPPAHQMTAQLLSELAEVPGAEHFVGPDQAALQQMLSGR